MCKVMIIAYYFPPSENGGTERPKNFYKYLKEYGFDTYVVTTKYDYTVYDDQDDTNIIRIKDYCHYSTNIITVGFLKIIRTLSNLIGIPLRGEDFWGRNVRKEIDRIISEIHPDVCLATFPPPSCLDIQIYLQERYPDIFFITDFRDGLMFEPILPEIRNHSSSLRMKKNAVHRYSEMEKRAVLHSSALLTVSDAMTSYFLKKYGNVPVYTITNGFNNEENIHAAPLELPEDEFVILYTGSLDNTSEGVFSYFKKVMELLLLKVSNVKIVMIGNYRKYETDFFSEHNQIMAYPKQKRQMILATQRKADMLLMVTGEKDPGATSGKLFEYLFAKKPVLNIGKNNNAQKIIAETDSGRSYGLSDIDSIVKYIKDAQTGNLKLKHSGLYKYTRRAGAEKLALIIENGLLKRKSDEKNREQGNYSRGSRSGICRTSTGC